MTPEEKIALFLALFRGRSDVFSVRWERADESGYRPVHAAFGPKVVESHLRGSSVVGVYPLLSDNRTWFLAIDCDGAAAAHDAQALAKQCLVRELPIYLERSRSGEGFHLWFFFQEAIQANKARAFAAHLVKSAGIQLRSLDRFFPSQDFHVGRKGLGNLIALPLQKRARGAHSTIFVDPQTLAPVPCQWTLLSNVQRLNEETLDLVLSEPADVLYAPLPLIKATQPPSKAFEAEVPVKIILREHLEVSLPCPRGVLEFLRTASRFQNPVWFQKFKQGHYLGDTPRFIRCGGRVGDTWVAARGVWVELQDLLRKHSVSYQLQDLRTSPEAIDEWQKDFQLRPDQLQVVHQLMPHEEAVLEAPTGTGKTVIALEMLVRRGVPALILVPSRALLEQWLERLEQNLGIGKRQVGLIRQSKLTLGERVTVTTFQSLVKRDLEELVHHCAHVIVDECHHAPAKTFAAVLRQLKPKYLLGLSATPRRKDKLERLIFAYLGRRVKSASPKELDRKSIIVLPHLVHHRTSFEHSGEIPIQTLLGDVSRNEQRNQAITADVVQAVHEGHLVLLLSDRKEHCDLLSEALGSRVGVATIYGGVGKKARKKVFSEFESGAIQVLISTARLLGEGWDCPPLSALFLALPMGGSPRLEQLAGRLTRPDPDKPTPVVHDYLDHKVPVLQAMFHRRLKVFRRLLGEERIPNEFQKSTPNKRASIRYGNAKTRVRKSNVVKEDTGQLFLFE